MFPEYSLPGDAPVPTAAPLACTQEAPWFPPVPPPPPPRPCGPLPGTILRIFTPPGAVINLLNLIEIASPSGICFIVRLPFLGGDTRRNTKVQSLINAVQTSGDKAETVQQ